MLRNMRNDFKKYSWTLWLVIIAFMGGFVVIDGLKSGRLAKDDMIFVGDTTIKVEDYQKQMITVLKNYKAQFKDNFNKRLITQFGIPEQILQQTINTAIIRSEAKKLNITASDEELKNKIINLPSLQQDGKFVGVANYRRALAHNRINVEDFETNLKDEIIKEKYMALVTGGLVLDNDTLQGKYKREKDTAELDYILLKPSSIKDKVEVNDGETDAYYQEHKEDFKSAEQRAGNLIAFKFDDYKKDVAMTEQELFDYYRANQTQYVEQAKTKVSRILLKHDGKNTDDILKKAEALQKELTAENFAQKAKEVSQGDKAKEGGDHGYYAWQRFSKQEKAIIGSLDQGEISTPVNTGTGFALLFVSEKVAKKQKEYDNVKEIIRTTLEKKKLDQLVKNKLEVIYKKIEKSENIKEQAKKLAVDVVETELLTSGGPVKDIDPSGYISRQLFQLKEKEVSTPFTFAQGMAMVQLTKIQKPEVEPLDKVKDKVKAAAVKVKKFRRLLQDAKAVTAELNKMTDEKKIEKYLKDKEMSATNSTYRRGNRLAQLPVKKGLDELIFSLAENRYSDPIDMTNEVVIVKVKTKKVTAAADFENDRADFYTQKLNEMRNSYFTSYVYNKRETYDVRINQELYLKTKEDILTRFN